MTRLAREHPVTEQVPEMKDPELWDYILLEAAYLASDDQRRIPHALHEAIEEAARRAGIRQRKLTHARNQAVRLAATLEDA